MECQSFIVCKHCRSVSAIPSVLSNMMCDCEKSESSRRENPSNRKRNIITDTLEHLLDLDRHCAVIISPSGVPCMRSLSCKSHSQTSKMAIKGRSRPFTELLEAYIKENPSKDKGAASLQASIKHQKPSKRTESLDLIESALSTHNQHFHVPKSTQDELSLCFMSEYDQSKVYGIFSKL